MQTYYYEQRRPLEAGGVLNAPYRIERWQPSSVGAYRDLYCRVGERWNWGDRLELSDEELGACLARPNVRTYRLMEDRSPAGFAELVVEAPEVEIKYLGLLPEQIGGGLGGPFLHAVLEEAWEAAPRVERVWLHTCDEDHPAARPLYERAGFRLYRIEEEA